MKPSEIIKKKVTDHYGNREGYPDDYVLSLATTFDKSVMSYLDEEKQRVNDVLHELVSALHDGSFDTQNCNYLHQMIDETLPEDNE